MILKIRDAEPALVRFEIEDSLRRLGLERIDIVQLVHDDACPKTIVQDFLDRGERWKLVESFKKEGKIGSAALYLTRNRSLPLTREALETGLFDAVIFYNNLMEYDVPDGLESFIPSKPELPVLALRTVYGGLVIKTGEAGSDAEKARKLDHLNRLAEEYSNGDPVELSMRFILAHGKVQTTIGGTKNLQHLEHFLRLSENIRPLPEPVAQEIRNVSGIKNHGSNL
jgi:aryl-alcohol dehydrogenase-like predicted oxidoreductase